MKNLDNKKILLVRNDNIGDLICTTPAIEALRKKYPKAQIDIVVNSYNYSAIRNNPFINCIYCYTKPKHKKSIQDKIKAGLGKLKILWQVKKEGYDSVIVFRSDYSKSAELFCNITNASYKIGVKNPNGKDNFNIHIPIKQDKHEVEFCFDCLKPLGVEHDKEKTYFYIEDKYIQKFSKYHGSILFHISARMKPNQVSYKKLKQILLKLNLNLILTADPKDWRMAEKLEKQTKAILIKTNSFFEWAGVIKNAKFFITVEGGAMHIAPALGIKTMALFGCSEINKWHPWGYKHLVLQDKSHIAENIDNQIIINKILKNI